MEEEIKDIQWEMDDKVQLVEIQIEETLETIQKCIKKVLYYELDVNISEWRGKYVCIVAGTKTRKSKKKSWNM